MSRPMGLTGICLIVVLLAAGCVTTEPVPGYDYTQFRAEDPRSILIVPVINRSVEVDAPDFFLSTISKPVAERGYYPFPVNMVKRILEDDGLSDANLVHGADPRRLGELFGADAVLYVSIEQWNAKYLVLSTTVTVEFAYVLKSTGTGEEIWSSSGIRQFSSDGGNSSGNLLADLVVSMATAAIEKASPNYVPMAQQANAQVTSEPKRGIPAGPYHPEYKKDR